VKPERIDLQEQYPCPRCKRGRLQAILLTEAFGCDRCQQIFGLSEDNQTIEQLSTSYPYTKTWQWVAAGWRSKDHVLSENYLPLVLGSLAIAFFITFWLPRSFQQLPPSPGVVFWITITFLVMTLPTLMLWLVLRDSR
jgi:hypothetical protein